MDEGDYIRFLNSIREFNRLEPIGSLYEKAYRDEKESNSQLGIGFQDYPSLVDIICYCLNPNHYHLILKQLRDGGISKFMHKINLGYTNYFNLKNKRNGSLFQGKFKAVQIKSFEHLLWLTVYVNTNAQIHGIIDDAVNYPWCSYPDYLGIKEDNFCNKDIILNQVQDYKKIAKETALFMKEKKDMEKYLLE